MSALAGLRDIVRRCPHERRTLAGAPASILRTASPSSCLLLAFRDGVAYEPEDLWGAGHFMEHIVFRGTERYPSLLALSRAVEGKGGRISAFSTRDTVAFWAKCLPGREEEAAEVLAELVARPRLSPGAMAAEKAVIRQERQRELNDPGLAVSLLLESLLLEPEPSSRHPVGSTEGLDRLEPEALRAYLGSAYTRANSAAAAAGCLPEGVESILEKTLLSLPPGAPRAKASFPVRSRLSGQSAVLAPSGHKTQAFLSLGWKLSLRDERERLAWGVLNTLLGAGYTSLFNVALREKAGLTYLCATRLHGYGESLTFKLGLALPASELGRALALVEENLRSAAESLLDVGIFEEAVLRHAANLLYQLEDPLNTVRLLSRGLLGGEPPFSFDERLLALETLEPGEVLSLAGRLDPGTRKAVVMTGSDEAAAVFPGALRLERREDGELVL